MDGARSIIINEQPVQLKARKKKKKEREGGLLAMLKRGLFRDPEELFGFYAPQQTQVHRALQRCIIVPPASSRGRFGKSE